MRTWRSQSSFFLAFEAFRVLIVGFNLSDALERWTSQVPVADPTTYKVDCEKKFLENVWIPNPSSIPPRPNQNQKDELEDWEHDISALHEWVGMAGLHAER